MWRCDKMIDPNHGDQTPLPCMWSTKEPHETTPLIPENCSARMTLLKSWNALVKIVVTKHLKLTPSVPNKQDVANCFVCVGTIGYPSFKLSPGQLVTPFNMHVYLCSPSEEKSETKSAFYWPVSFLARNIGWSGHISQPPCKHEMYVYVIYP